MRLNPAIIAVVIVVMMSIPCVPAFTNPSQEKKSAESTATTSIHPWPMFRHDSNHTGQSEFNASSNSGEILWEFNTSECIYCSPSIGEGDNIIIPAFDTNVLNINSNGTLKWSVGFAGFTDAGPVIDNQGNIFAGSIGGSLLKIYPNGSVADIVSTEPIYSSPVIDLGGRIYLSGQFGSVFAINPNGSIEWVFNTGGTIQASSVAIGRDGTLYVGNDNGKLCAINPNGTKRWNYSVEKALRGIWSSPAISLDNTIYVGADNNNTYAFNSNGTLKWSFKTNGYITASPAIGKDGTIYIGSNDTYFYAINPNGTLKWKYKTNSAIYSSAAISDDNIIFFGTYHDYLYALNSNGTKRWAINLSTDFYSSPAICSDGSVVIGGINGFLYKIGTKPVPEFVMGIILIPLTFTATLVIFRNNYTPLTIVAGLRSPARKV